MKNYKVTMTCTKGAPELIGETLDYQFSCEDSENPLERFTRSQTEGIGVPKDCYGGKIPKDWDDVNEFLEFSCSGFERFQVVCWENVQGKGLVLIS